MPTPSTTPRKTALKAEAMLLVVAIIWGGGFVAGKVAVSGASPEAVLAYRFLGGAVIIGALFARRIRRSGSSVILPGLLIGIVGFIAQYIQLIGLQYTTSGKQSFIVASYVVLTPFLAWLVLRERPSLRNLLAACLALAGIGLISLEPGLVIGFGDGISLASTVFFALQIVLIAKYASSRDPLACTFYMLLSNGTCALIMALALGSSFAVAGSEALGGVLYLLVLNTALGMALQFSAQRFADSRLAALILSLEAVFGYLFSVLYFGEALTARMILGGGLTFAAIVLSQLGGSKKDAPAKR